MKHGWHVMGVGALIALVLGFGAFAAPSHAAALPGGYAVSGHVLDGDGAGVEGVEVSIYGGTSFDTVVATSTTGADGAYATPAVPDGAYQAYIEPDPIQGPIAPSAGPNVTVAGADVTGVDFVYDAIQAGTVMGTVDGPTGVIAGASVTIDGEITDATDAEGFYRFDLLDPGAHEIEIAADGFATQTIPFEVVVDEITIVDATLESVEHTVSGVVRDTAGDAVVGATVSMYSGTPVPENLVAETTSDEDGYFAVSLPDGVYQAWVLPAGVDAVASIANPFTVLGDDVVNVNFIVAEPAGSLTGTVAGQGEGLLEGAYVSIEGGPETATEAGGAYSILGLASGQYSVTYSADGYVSRTVVVEIVSGRPTTREITLVQVLPTVLAGTVHGVSGPLAGATVDLSGEGSAATDGSGAYVFSGITGGSHTATFSAPGYVTATRTVSVSENVTTTADVTLVAQVAVTTLAVAPSGPDGANGWYTSAPAISVTRVPAGGSTCFAWDTSSTPSMSSTTSAHFAVAGLQGTHTLWVSSVSYLGTPEVSPKSAAVKVDSQAPTCAVAVEAVSVTSEAATVRLTAGDAEPGSGVDRIEYVFLPAGTSPTDATVWTPAARSSVTTDAPAGRLTVFARSFDVAGNVSGMQQAAAYVPQGAFIITPSAGANGSISPAGAQTVTAGSNAAFTISPAAGYHIEDVRVDGNPVGAVGSYAFTDVRATHTISAEFGRSLIHTSLSISASHSHMTAGHHTTFSGKISPSMPNKTHVKFYVQKPGSHSWTYVATVHTYSSHHWKYSYHAAAHGTYHVKVTFAATSKYEGATSRTYTIVSR